MQSTAEQEVNSSGIELARQIERLSGHSITSRATEDQLAELRLESVELASLVEESLTAAANRQENSLSSIDTQRDFPATLPGFTSYAPRIRSQTESLRARSAELLAASEPSRRAKLQKELDELTARRMLQDSLDRVLGEIERKERIAAYTVCVKETNTRNITAKSTEVTKRAVTSQLAAAFKREVERIGFSQLEVLLGAC